MNIEDHILIERYLKNSLNPEELNSFKERIEKDALFKEQVMMEKQLMETLDPESWSSIEHIDSEVINEYENLFKGNDAQELKHIISDVNETYLSKKSNKGFSWKLYAVAASAIIIAGLSIVLNSDKSNTELYHNYLDISQLPSLIERESNSSAAKAQLLFEQEKYTEASELFQSILNDKENKSKGIVLLYLGISQMESGNPVAAEKSFNQLIKSSSLDAQRGYWYKALSYLKNNDIKAAKEVLTKISSEKLYNYTKANELLEEL